MTAEASLATQRQLHTQLVRGRWILEQLAGLMKRGLFEKCWNYYRVKFGFPDRADQAAGE